VPFKHRARYKGSWTSRQLRAIFELKPVRKLVGFILASITLILGLAFPHPASGDLGTPIIEIVTLSTESIALTTSETTQDPLHESNYQINQGFHSWHPGIDLDGNSGDPVYPIIKGKVISIKRERYAYGNHLIIDHGHGVQSLYAHLNSINTNLGTQVTNDTQIGTVGSTGQSTGSHLHLEIIDQGRRINPLSLLKP